MDPEPRPLDDERRHLIDEFGGRAVLIIEDFARRALVAARSPEPGSAGSICVCGLAKNYHPRLVTDGHEYEPRYPARSLEPGLDVERLRHACLSLGIDLVRLDENDVRIWHMTGNEAAEIAAEYARLRDEP